MPMSLSRRSEEQKREKRSSNASSRFLANGNNRLMVEQAGRTIWNEQHVEVLEGFSPRDAEGLALGEVRTRGTTLGSP